MIWKTYQPTFATSLVFHAVSTLDEVFELTLLPDSVEREAILEPVGTLRADLA